MTSDMSAHVPILQNMNSLLQYNLTDRKHYEQPAYSLGTAEGFLSKAMKGAVGSEARGFHGIIDSGLYLEEINRLRKTEKYGSQPQVASYDELGPLQRLNLMSCGDTADFFLMDINGANMGDGTGSIPPGPTYGCPAGDSKFNTWANPRYRIL